MPWTRAVHLNQWADTELSSRQLPLLVRRLIRKTVPDVTKLNIPANEQVGRPGFDGTVECSIGNEFVPAGTSVWEMGTNQSPQTKAKRDFLLRTSQLLPEHRAQTSFVFVTPRHWQGKDEWASQMADQEGWKRVVVHDSNSLEHWLDLARDVDAWISHFTRRIPPGVVCLEQHWKRLRGIGEYPLRPDVFTAGRDTETESIERLLSRHPDSLFIRTPCLDDGIDFLAALAAHASEDIASSDPKGDPQHVSLLHNGVIVFSEEDWRELVNSHGPLLLIASPSLQLSSTDIAGAIDASHYVIVSGPRGVVPPGKGIELRGVQQYRLEEALESSGYAESQSQAFAKASAGNTTILKRRISTHADTQLPEWSKRDVAPDLAIFALLGGWAHVDPKPRGEEGVPRPFRQLPPADLEVLELIGLKVDRLNRVIAQWQEFPEPLFLRFGESVLVTSREDAWYLLGDYVADQQLKQFHDLAILLLDENNPALDLDADKRWMASIYGKTHSFSGELRRSVVETLAIVATCPTAKCTTPSPSLTAMVESVVETVLPLGADWKRWASLRSHFDVFGEAAPEIFLSRVEDDLKSDHPAVLQLFHEQTGSVLGGWMHTELLWALERLAWSGEYLPRVSLILAHLVRELPPLGNNGNHPLRSLHEIFLLQIPHTNASIEERVAALKTLLQVEPTVGWKLLLALLPGHMVTSHGTLMPRWQHWADGWSRTNVFMHRYEYAMAVAEVAFEAIGESPQKWSEALEGMLLFNDDVSKRVFTVLDRTAKHHAASVDEAFELWEALRSLIQRHQNFADADWALPLTTLQELIAIRDRLVPSDPVLKNRWLFDAHAELPGYREYDDYRDHDAAREEAQIKALRVIVNSSGCDGVRRLLALGADGSTVGYICGKHALCTDEEALLPESLTASDPNVANFAGSLARASFGHKGEWAWVDSLSCDSWPYDARVRIALSLPFGPRLWDWVRDQGDDIATAYWSREHRFVHPWDEPQVRRAVAELLKVSRPYSAIRMIGILRDVQKPSDLIADLLDAGLAHDTTEELGDIAHDIQDLIGQLQADRTFDRQHLIQLEWGYLPLLERSSSPTWPETLVAAATEDPSFFVELVRTAFRSKSELREAVEVSDVRKLHIARAAELLHHLDTLPGMNEAGKIDAAVLRHWVEKVIELSTITGHDEIAKHKVGQLIGHALHPHLDDTDLLRQVAPIIEEYADDDLTSGLINGILNSRGMTTRDPFDGGKQEHSLADTFMARADMVRKDSPKLAKCFQIIRDHYDQYAKREDDDAARLRMGR